MSKFKVLVLAIIPLFLGMWFSTEIFASLIDYDPYYLGNGLFSIGEPGTPDYLVIYAPWKYISWYLLFDEYVPDLFTESCLGVLIGLVLSCLFIYFFVPKKPLTSHGSAHWAVYNDLLKMDLVSSNGVVIGLWDSPFKQKFTKFLRNVENVMKEKKTFAKLDFDRSHMKKVDEKIIERTKIINEMEKLEVQFDVLRNKQIKGISEDSNLKHMVETYNDLKIRKENIDEFVNHPPEYKPKGFVYLWCCYYDFLNHLYRHISHFYLRDNSNKHLAVVAPTRSGKGVGLIIPTLLGSWNESCVVNDIKSENWGITAGYRKKMGQKVIKFEPTADDGSTARWNPLDEVPICSAQEVSMAQNLAQIIADSEGKGKADHWIANAGNVIMACILHLKYAHYADPEHYPNEPNLYTVASFLKANVTQEKPTASSDDPAAKDLAQAKKVADQGGVSAKEAQSSNSESVVKTEQEQKKQDVKGFVDTIKGMLDFHHIPEKGLHFDQWDSENHCFKHIDFTFEDLKKLYPDAETLREEKYKYTHPIILQAFMEISSKPADELGSIISTANTALKEYLDPVLAKNTSHSDFCVDDLMNYERPVTLYLVTPPSDLIRLSPIFRLFFELMVRRHAKKIGDYKNGQAKSLYKHKCLMLMDEFSSLGNMTSFTSALSYIAGYGLKVFLIAQGIPQIAAIYGRDNHIIMNCHLRIFYAPNDIDSATFVEKGLGNTTYLQKSRSENSTGGFFSRESVSTSEAGRPLMTADEVSRMGDKEIIFATGFPSVFTDKVKYYENSYFLEKLCDAPVVSDTTRPVEKDSYPERFVLLNRHKEELRKEETESEFEISQEQLDAVDLDNLDYSLPILGEEVQDSKLYPASIEKFFDNRIDLYTKAIATNKLKISENPSEWTYPLPKVKLPSSFMKKLAYAMKFYAS